MRKTLKKITSTILTCAILFSGMFIVPQAGSTAQAAAKYYLPSSYRNMVFYSAPDDLPATYVTLKVCQKGSFKKPKASSIRSLTTSDSSVAKPYIDRFGNIRIYFFKKPGAATISFRIGKQVLRSKITVKEYGNPLSKFKIGKKNFLSRFSSSTEYNYFYENPINNQTVSIKTAKGWKISSMKMKYGSGTYEISSCSKSSFSKRVTFVSDADYITLTMYHAKTKSYVTLTLNCIKE